MARKALKFIYGQVFIKDGTNHTSQIYGLHNFIEEISKLKNYETIIEIYNYKIKIEDINFYGNNRYAHICLMKMTDTALPYKTFTDDRRAEALHLDEEEYLGKETHILYDMNNMVLMFQNTKESLSDVNLCLYINELLHKKVHLLNDNETINIKPIVDTKSFSSSSKSKKINISFANITQLNRYKIPTLGNIIENFNKFGGITGTITISIGHKSINNSELDNNEVQELITELKSLNKSDKECLKYARVSYLENGNTYQYDLFDDIMNDIVDIDAPPKSAIPLEDIALEMLKLYTDRLPKINQIIKYE